jgi:AraC-like DNA-binding protein
MTLPAVGGCLWFHVVTSGHARLEVADRVLEMGPGDVVLVPHGEGHVLRSGADVLAPDIRVVPQEIEGRYVRLRHGGPGAATTMVCGAVRFDHPVARPLLATLPAIVHVPVSPLTDRLHDTLRLIALEVDELRPGGEAVITRLADVLVVQALRSWLTEDAEARTGWLAALSDPQVGRALAAIHRDPAHPWTVASLAAEQGLSRSAFAARFTALVGEPAMAYVTRWRMDLAHERLRSGDDTVARLATALGYRSEAAFSRAFRRVVGEPPGAVRGRGAPDLDALFAAPA